MDFQTKKDIGALFPRVHLSETRVPGPRAPPRNKMALFEQFTIPPHRFVPPLGQENSHKVKSQSDLSSRESGVSCRSLKCEALRCSVAELGVYSETIKCSAACDSGEKDCSLLPLRHASPPDTLMQNLWNCSTAESDVPHYAKLSFTDIRTQHSTVESRPISLSTKRMAMPPCGCTEIGDCDTVKLHTLSGAIAENHSYISVGTSYGSGIANSGLIVGSAMSSGRYAGISLVNEESIPKGFWQIEKITDEGIHDCIGANDMGNLVQKMVCSDRSSEVAGDMGQEKHIMPLEKCAVERLNPDILPRIIPKHVIGVIGQREFWEARKTMLQQQTTLSMQVFELHRLIEVQRLITAMPGHLLEGKNKCFVVKGSTQLKIAEVSNKSVIKEKPVIKESLNKEARHGVKLKQAVVKGPKKPTKPSCGVVNTTVNVKCQNSALKVPPLRPIHAALDYSRVSTWGTIPTWVKPGSHNYGLCRGPMAFEPSSSAHLYNGQQVLQNGSYGFTNWSRPCNFLPKCSPEVNNPPLACQKLINDGLIHQLDSDPIAQTSESLPTPNQTTSVLRKSSYSTLNPSSWAQRNKPNINSQQEACIIVRQGSSGCKKLASQSMKFTGDPDAPDRAESMSTAGSHEFRSERSALGFQTFRKMVPTRVSESETFAQAEKAKDMIAATESYRAHKNDPLFPDFLGNVLSLQRGEKNGVTTSKVIRAVPHPASEAMKAAAKILKSIQQSESSQAGGYCLQ